jgi:hypothetical protein
MIEITPTTPREPSLAELIAERETLLAEKAENAQVIASCRAQMDAAKARHWDDGGYADADWWARVNIRVRYAGQRDQEIGLRLSELRREMHLARQRENVSLAETAGVGDDPIRLLKTALVLIGRAIDLLKSKPEG